MRPATFLAIALALSTLSCDRGARVMARRTRSMLDEYSTAIATQIKRESEYYQRDAVLETRKRHENLANSAKADRAGRYAEVAADIARGEKSPLLVRSYLRDYAESEYNTRKAVYWAEADATREILARLQALEANADRVEALGKALEALAEKPDLKAEAGNLGGVAADAKTQFDALVCDGIRTRLNDAAGADKPALEQLAKDRGCAAQQ